VPDPRVRRLAPLGRRAEPVLAVALVAAAATEQLVQPGTEHSLWAVAAVIAFCAPILVRRDHPVIATPVASTVLVAVALIADFSPAPIVFLVPPILAYSCGAHAPPRQGLLAIAALAVALQVQLGFADAPNVEIAVQTLPLWWAGLEVSRRRLLVHELARRTRELAAEEEAFVQLSVRRERARIARDLHDIVSHHLAVIVIQAGAGRLAEPWQAAVAAERFATIGDAGVQALAETERLVAVLQADETGAPRLAQLLERTRATGAQVIVSPADPALSPETEAIAYRVVQEALTNVMKHAPGAAVEVHLGLRDGELTITVYNGTAVQTSAIAHTGSGLGLAGMRERLEALGGSLAAGPDAEGGFRLRARLPISSTNPRGGRRSPATITGDSPPSRVPSIVRDGTS
jgi:signal transduction histidine kinase